jgi:hypothetical protein
MSSAKAEEYRYQRFVSDIAGQDVHAHGNDPAEAISVIRNWLRTYSAASIPSGSVIWDRYQAFQSEMPAMCMDFRLAVNELIFNDYALLVSRWLRADDKATR